MSASHNDYDTVVSLLIERGANVNSITNMSYTPLIWASQKGNLNVVRLLIENGADINLKNNIGDTALTCATKNGHDSVVNLLKSTELSCVKSINKKNTSAALMWYI